MWHLVFWLNLVGPKRFLKYFAFFLLGMGFFLYIFVHDAFDGSRPQQGRIVKIGRALKPQAPTTGPSR